MNKSTEGLKTVKVCLHQWRRFYRKMYTTVKSGIAMYTRRLLIHETYYSCIQRMV